MHRFKVGDLVDVPPFMYLRFIYDKDKPSYPIKEILIENIIKNFGYGSGNYRNETEYKYLVDIDGEIKQFDIVKHLPNFQIDGISISDFQINGKNINKIEFVPGEWILINGEHQPTYPNRHKYTLSDNSIVESSEYNILNIDY
jgi:hypothetical protein